MVKPPETLLVECDYPDNGEEVLHYLKNKNTKDAATAFVRYVLNTRDIIDVCNSRIANIRLYLNKMDKEVANK